MNNNRKKQMSLFLAVLVMMAAVLTQPFSAQAATLDIEAESAILVDAETGKILYAKNQIWHCHRPA